MNLIFLGEMQEIDYWGLGMIQSKSRSRPEAFFLYSQFVMTTWHLLLYWHMYCIFGDASDKASILLKEYSVQASVNHAVKKVLEGQEFYCSLIGCSLSEVKQQLQPITNTWKFTKYFKEEVG
jgi:hypothetical protein